MKQVMNRNIAKHEEKAERLASEIEKGGEK